jgi:hypothetical protein
MKNISVIFVLVLVISACGSIQDEFKEKNEEQTFSLRTDRLTVEEKKLLQSNKIEIDYFYQTFADILISEIRCNSKLKGYNRDSINGIIFCGKAIQLEEIITLRNQLNGMGLVLEVSLDRMIYTRYKEFEFPGFTDKTELENLDKNYYKIYEKKKGISFVEQISYFQKDKTELIAFYKLISEKYDGFPLWADGEENLLYVPNNKSDELVQAIYDFKDFVSPKAYGIENGWYTKESLLNGIRQRLPIIDFGFYDQ